MAKPKLPKPKKRGPKEERLIISEDPEIVLARLLKPAPPLPKPPKPKRTK
jgi:hypothetical protein